MHLVYTTVEGIGPDEQDPARLELRLAPVPGLANPSLGIAQDQLDGFLAVLGVTGRDDLLGRPVRVTVDDEEGTERIAFLTPAEAAEAAEPAGAALPAEPVVASPAEPVSVSPVEPDVSTRGVPVMAGPAPADEVTVYDGEGGDWMLPPAADEECAEPVAASLTPAEHAVEEQAQIELAEAASAPLEKRYFLYRETYGQGARQSVVELTPEEFALLGGSGAYLHVDDCMVIGVGDLIPDTVLGVERLLTRATSRPQAALLRPELEHLAAAGHVVSCAVY